MFPLIIKIGRMSMSIGLNMKAISYKTVKMDKENYFCRMEKFLREISKKIWFGEKEY
jgi:hypothetical protein